VHFPNSRLWSSPLVNLTRSGRRTEITRLVMDTDAPARARDALQGALAVHARGPGKGDFHGEPKARRRGLGVVGVLVVWRGLALHGRWPAWIGRLSKGRADCLSRQPALSNPRIACP
jgi:hypothetical protein